MTLAMIKQAVDGWKEMQTDIARKADAKLLDEKMKDKLLLSGAEATLNVIKVHLTLLSIATGDPELDELIEPA